MSLNSHWAPLFAEVSEDVTRSSCVFKGEVIECWGNIEDTLASCWTFSLIQSEGLKEY